MKNKKELIEGLTPFPEDVFSSNQPWLNNYLLPLISIDLGMLRKDLKGTIAHMITPIEPYEGLIGEETADYHNEFCGENWISLELTSDNKYRFLGEENYFLSAPDHKNKTDDEFNEYIKEVHKNYKKIKATYKLVGKLLPWQKDNPQNFLNNVGGETSMGNWTDTSPIPSKYKMTISEEPDKKLPNDGISILYKEKEFMYVAEVPAYNYCGEGADAIIMFFEPESRIVLFTFDWT